MLRRDTPQQRQEQRQVFGRGGSTTSAVRERIAEEFKGVSFELIQSNLTSEQEAQLLADFGD